MVKLRDSIVFESVEELYHFTNVGNLINILEEDKLCGYQCCDYKDDKDDKYYGVSTTRQRCALLGYPHTMINKQIVRITFDANKLLQKYKTKTFVYDDSYRTPQYAKKMWNTKQWNVEFSSMYEAEERIKIYNGDCIKDLHKYIKRIDVCSSTFGDYDFDKIDDYCSKYNIILKLYSNQNKFNYGV